ncbi:MAG: hypothetical protein KAS04_05660 [Candidatus Aenigmarchaeota archaeon]|nr:hypothetical protein [Candidatus Aenigmarchaeota archaeon]
MGIKNNVKLLLILLTFVIIVPTVSAEEVCVVYFTASTCGDRCVLTDSFMEGLINEYSDVLAAIKYDVSVPGNMDVFGAYKYNYGISSDVPVVLFGQNDYFADKTDIFKNTEARIMELIAENGSNCPLTSGSIPPASAGAASLPGNPQVFEIVDPTNPEDFSDEKQPAENDDNEKITEDVVEINFQSLFEEPTKPENIPIWIGVAVVFIIMIVSLTLTYGRKGK